MKVQKKVNRVFILIATLFSSTIASAQMDQVHFMLHDSWGSWGLEESIIEIEVYDVKDSNKYCKPNKHAQPLASFSEYAKETNAWIDRYINIPKNQPFCVNIISTYIKPGNNKTTTRYYGPYMNSVNSDHNTFRVITKLDRLVGFNGIPYVAARSAPFPNKKNHIYNQVDDANKYEGSYPLIIEASQGPLKIAVLEAGTSTTCAKGSGRGETVYDRFWTNSDYDLYLPVHRHDLYAGGAFCLIVEKDGKEYRPGPFRITADNLDENNVPRGCKLEWNGTNFVMENQTGCEPNTNSYKVDLNFSQYFVSEWNANIKIYERGSSNQCNNNSGRGGLLNTLNFNQDRKNLSHAQIKATEFCLEVSASSSYKTRYHGPFQITNQAEPCRIDFIEDGRIANGGFSELPEGYTTSCEIPGRSPQIDNS